MVGSETCVLSINRTLRLWDNLGDHAVKMTLQKLFLDIFHVTTLSFSNITLIVNPSTSKMVGGATYILFTAWLTAQMVNQPFLVAIKTMVYFIRLFRGKKLVNSSIIFMLLQTSHLELPHLRHPTFISTEYNLDLTVKYFIFLAIRSEGVRKPSVLLHHCIKKEVST